MVSLYVCVCTCLGDAYLNFEWLLKFAELISKTLKNCICEHVPLNRTCFIWDSNRAQTDLKMLGHGSQGAAGSKGIKGCISVH